MVHTHLAQAVGKRIVGKQNVIPLLRDAAEDDRQIMVTVDKERSRLRGHVTTSRSNTGQEVIIADEVASTVSGASERRNRAVAVDSVLAMRIDSIDGETDPRTIEVQHAARERRENFTRLQHTREGGR